MNSNIQRRSFYRTELKERCGKRFTFYATIDRAGFRDANSGCFHLLLTNVYIEDKKVADHVWLVNVDLKHIKQLKAGLILKLSATVYQYGNVMRYGLKDIGYFEVIK